MVRGFGRKITRFITICVVFGVCVLLLKPLRSTSDTDGHDDSHVGVQIGNDKKQPKSPGEKTRKTFEGKEPAHDSNGPGENGNPVHLQGEELEQSKLVMKKWFMNVIASDKISLDRKLMDTRDATCKSMMYDEDLPSASVVVIFHNEAWTPLLRTVHSVVNRSPPDLLHEVVLLDDASDREELQDKLTEYVKRWGKLVKLVRVPERQGLIRARLRGAEAATGDVLVFLDSHCEANYGYLEPLLQRIKDQPNSVLVPSIDMISDDTMAYWGGPVSSVGGFWWSLHFKWDPMPASERERRKQSSDPIRSPTMPGGLFALGRQYFWDLGSYDSGMDIWGGENLEMSFRTWMCGGILEFIPCSHVGHIFRAGHPYNMTTKDVHGLNSKRLAEVWMDEYKRLFYHHRHDLEKADAGDFQDRIELRNKLKCKSFKWFLDNIVPHKFIPDEDVFAYGAVKNPATNFCLDTLQRDEKHTIAIGVFFCQSGGSSSQMFSYAKDKQIRREETCLDVVDHGQDASRKIELYQCASTRKFVWEVQLPHGRIKHEKSGLCIDAKNLKNSDDISARPCEEGSPTQEWVFEHVL